nr:MAG TPA: hypothetical protein [Caudoviricetes sp.]
MERWQLYRLYLGAIDLGVAGLALKVAAILVGFSSKFVKII